ncbi:hypothetical protein GBF35_29705 [Nonomuraea phyllanthi]|uniref:organomercurial lyase n=1 Tax=Nonomuraea phyllanthi TaxID=2219224 RepID=UPI001293CE02|nr:organomercurial lyase [Nonomuraea phyllanthi]QFY10251.1 hypothetical protein GBF35_29705 [Nonomuraea phyllanthi]
MEAIRLAVYRSFAETGRAPTVDDLAVSLPREQVIEALDRLGAGRDLVMRDGRIVMAHPFSAVPLGFSVMGQSTLWWGGCAWDSFALPHLLSAEGEVLVATRCPNCAAPHAWAVGREAPPEGEQVAHFLVPVARMWDNVLHTCANQRLFCGPDCVEVWLRRTGHDRGYVMDLTTLWRLARGWYAGRLDPGYQRRDPAASAEYFARAGLTGPFWQARTT